MKLPAIINLLSCSKPPTSLRGQHYERVNAEECLLGGSCSFIHSCRECNYYRPINGKWQERVKNEAVL